MLRASHSLRSLASMMPSELNRRLVCVVGTTGSGKSQLAVELALRFNGEVINSDALQLYDGLPIITNKTSVADRRGIPHHLLGCVNLRERTWRADIFARRALQTLEDVWQRGKVAILVGGTNYYVQSLLFSGRLVQKNSDNSDLDALHDDREISRWPILNATSQEMLEELKKVDPIMAARWHPNDARRIRRSLMICLQTGRKASDVYAEQQMSKHEPFTQELDREDDQGRFSLRFPTLVLWTLAEQDILKQRLDSRVEEMVSSGLVAEAEDLANFALMEEHAGRPIDKTRGIYVAIGFKEFEPYLTSLDTTEDVDLALPTQIHEESVERTKIATRQYAKRQLRWLRIKLHHALKDADALHSFFALDTSNPEAWASKVYKPAEALTNTFLAGDELPDPKVASTTVDSVLEPLRGYDLGQRQDLWEQHRCDMCNVTAVTENDWSYHLQSSRHKRMLKKKARLQLVRTELVPSPEPL